MHAHSRARTASSHRRRGSVAAAIALALAAVVAVEDSGGRRAHAGERYSVTTSRIAAGLKLRRIVDSNGPNQIRVLDVDPAASVTLDVALATDRLAGHERPSSMAARHGAIAAVNGDFTIPPLNAGAGRPTGTFAEDGILKTSPLQWDAYFGKFAIARDEQSIVAGHRELSIWMRQVDTGERWHLRGWNPLYRPRGFSVSSPAGGRAFRPPQDSCSARLVRSARLAWTRGHRGVGRSYVVDRVRCSHRRLRRRGGMVVSARLGTERAASLEATLTRTETVRVAWSVQEPRVLDTIGGHPTLLQDGVVTPSACSGGGYFCDRHPRTGVGVTPAGHVLLVTVDGRQPGRSVGLTPLQFARLFVRLGATDALNLDGGGSSAMVVEGRLVNRPSDGAERPVGSALLVLPGPDAGEAEPADSWLPSAAGAVIAEDAGAGDAGAGVPSRSPRGRAIESAATCLALRDAGSTGGMIDALARRGLRGSRRDLPAVVRRSVAVFRGRAPCRAG